MKVLLVIVLISTLLFSASVDLNTASFDKLVSLKGIGKKFSRDNMITFGQQAQELTVKLTRIDTAQSVEISCDTSKIPTLARTFSCSSCIVVE